MFGRCEDMKTAHKLAASVFGIERPIHLKGDFHRATESINSGIFEKEPVMVTVTPRALLFHAGILKDDLSNYTLAYGIHARTGSGELYPGIKGFLERENRYRRRDFLRLNSCCLSKNTPHIRNGCWKRHICRSFNRMEKNLITEERRKMR